MVKMLHENYSASLVRKRVCYHSWVRSTELPAGSLYSHTWPLWNLWKLSDDLYTQKPEASKTCTNSSADKSQTVSKKLNKHTKPVNLALPSQIVSGAFLDLF